jgi:hypothetical protein
METAWGRVKKRGVKKGTRWEWHVDGTESHHLRFSYAGSCKLVRIARKQLEAYSLTETCTKFVEFCLAGIPVNVGIGRDDALSIVGSLLCAGSHGGIGKAP